MPPRCKRRAISSRTSGYVSDLNQTVQENDTLRSLNEDYDPRRKLEDFARTRRDRSTRRRDACGHRRGVVGSLFALLTIIVMSMFMVARGRGWVESLLARRTPAEAEALGRTLDRMAVAVSSYVGGAVLQATIAGITAFIVLSILGVNAPLALAVLIGLLDLIPLLGATIGAVLVAIVTLFTDFPTVTIIWVVFAIAYQQFENYVIQPRIQSRAVELDPFVIVVAPFRRLPRRHHRRPARDPGGGGAADASGVLVPEREWSRRRRRSRGTPGGCRSSAADSAAASRPTRGSGPPS